MPASQADLLLHPIRMRIILALVGRQMTAYQLAAALPDVPQATLYRHIGKLAQGGVLRVAEERPIRGTVEKVYTLVEGMARVTPEQMAAAGRDDHLRYFLTFLVSLLDSYARYLKRDSIDPVADGVGYSTLALYLSDEEFQQLAAALQAAVLPMLSNEPGPERRRRIVATIVLPDAEGGENAKEPV